MWFNNALIFQYELDSQQDLTTLLAEERLKPCPPHARFIYGWTSAFKDELVHEVAGTSLLCMGKEERILPRGVVKRLLEERIQEIEARQGRHLKRAEKAQLAEDLEFELLPKAFCAQKRLPAILDHNSKRLIINTSSPNQAAQLTALLRKSCPTLQVQSLEYLEGLAFQLTEWIKAPASLPSAFQLAPGCQLFSPDDEKKTFNCKGYDLPADEVLSLIEQGLIASEITLVWNERIQFTLTHNFILKRLKCLDQLTDDFNDLRQHEEEYQQQDAALVLLSGELRELINTLIHVTSKHTTSKHAA